MSDYESRIDQIQKTFKKRVARLEVPKSEFPELIVTVPDSWPYINLKPIYDAHVGHKLHAADVFALSVADIRDDPFCLSWNGGDFIENAIEGSPGMFSQRIHPGEQFDESATIVAPIQHKMIACIPGNHEMRTVTRTGFDIARHFADDCKLPYFPDYVFATIRWRGNKFRMCLHHGTGAAATAGGQRNAARKDMPWIGADLYWTGHLHQPMVDIVYRAEFDQRRDRMVTRTSVVIISPSHLTYFGGYAAAKRLGPGSIGLTVATLHANGDIEPKIKAKGKRL